MSIRDLSDEELKNEMAFCESINRLWQAGDRRHLDAEMILNYEARASNIYYEMRRRGMI